MQKILLLSMLASTAASETNTLTEVRKDFLSGFLEIAFPQSSWTTTERESIAKIVDDCEIKNDAAQKFLDDLADTGEDCSRSVSDVEATTDGITNQERTKLKACASKGKDLFLTHGGINTAASPLLTSAQKSVLAQCATATGVDYGKVFGILLNRFTTCEVTVTTPDEAVFAKLFNETGSENKRAILLRQNSVHAICNNLNIFEQLNSQLAMFANNNVISFIDSLRTISR